MFNFESKLYENPEQNLNELWWSLVKKYQMIDFSRDKPDWCSKIHFVIAPVYYHNYMLGELLASQIHAYIAKNILRQNNLKNIDYSNKEIGIYLKKSIFEQGMKYEWNKLIENATGEKLNPKYFVQEFVK
jgi:peptidyl-dipeptidase A